MARSPSRSMRPKMRPEADENTSRAMQPTVRPQPRPETLEKRMEMQEMRDRIEMGNRQDPGRTRREMEQGYAEGGMVRGCKAGQMSGKGFSGTY